MQAARPFTIRFSSAMSSACCTKLSATQSTPRRRAKARSSRSLGVRAETGMTASGTATPLRSDSLEPLSTVTSAHSSERSPTRRRMRPSSISSNMPVRRALKISGCGICTRVSSPGSGFRSKRILWPGLMAISTSANRPSRSFGPCRSARMPSGRFSAISAPRTALKAAAWSSCEPWLKFRRKTSTPAWASALTVAGARLAGPRVATMRARRALFMVFPRSGSDGHGLPSEALIPCANETPGT
ncbi:hypothetical protein D3C71_1240750 [compost metagenome]